MVSFSPDYVKKLRLKVLENELCNRCLDHQGSRCRFASNHRTKLPGIQVEADKKRGMYTALACSLTLKPNE